MRRRQNKQYLNKLPKPAKETTLIPTKYKQNGSISPVFKNANGFSMGAGPQNKTQMEVAAWMGRQNYHMESRPSVSQHMEEMSVLQQVTQMAPSHGKELNVEGDIMHNVSEARQAILIDNGLKRTYPLTKNQNAAINAQRMSQSNPPIRQGAHTIISKTVADRNEENNSSLGRQSTDINQRKSNLRTSSRGAAGQPIFNEDQAYVN